MGLKGQVDILQVRASENLCRSIKSHSSENGLKYEGGGLSFQEEETHIKGTKSEMWDLLMEQQKDSFKEFQKSTESQKGQIR